MTEDEMVTATQEALHRQGVEDHVLAVGIFHPRGFLAAGMVGGLAGSVGGGALGGNVGETIGTVVGLLRRRVRARRAGRAGRSCS